MQAPFFQDVGCIRHVEVCGEGGMGVVFKIDYLVDGRLETIAMKMQFNDVESQGAFIMEIHNNNLLQTMHERKTKKSPFMIKYNQFSYMECMFDKIPKKIKKALQNKNPELYELYDEHDVCVGLFFMTYMREHRNLIDMLPEFASRGDLSHKNSDKFLKYVVLRVFCFLDFLQQNFDGARHNDIGRNVFVSMGGAQDDFRVPFEWKTKSGLTFVAPSRSVESNMDVRIIDFGFTTLEVGVQPNHIKELMIPLSGLSSMRNEKFDAHFFLNFLYCQILQHDLDDSFPEFMQFINRNVHKSYLGKGSPRLDPTNLHGEEAMGMGSPHCVNYQLSDFPKMTVEVLAETGVHDMWDSSSILQAYSMLQDDLQKGNFHLMMTKYGIKKLNLATVEKFLEEPERFCNHVPKDDMMKPLQIMLEDEYFKCYRVK